MLSKDLRIILTIILGYSLIYMDKQLIALSIIPISQEFNLTTLEIGHIMAWYFIGDTLVQIPSGYLSDRIGANVVILVAIVLVAILSIVFVNMSIIFTLVFVRFIVGVSHGMYPGAVAKTIAEDISREKRVSGQSLILSSFGIGSFLAATIGAFL